MSLRKIRSVRKSRNGCFTCKQRKKKCDEVKPVCGHCKRLGFICNYGFKLSWVSKNQKLGKDGVELPPNFRVIEIINFTRNDMMESMPTHHDYDFEFPRQDVPQYLFEELKKDPIIGPRISEQYLFSLYKNVLSKTKSFAGSNEACNDFVQIVIPKCDKFPALYHSVLALSALDLIKTNLKRHLETRSVLLLNIYNTLFIQYKNDAINCLHDILDGFDVNKVDMLEELVLTIVLLCNLEITNKGNKDWIQYLSEACLVLNSLSSSRITSSGVFTFAYKYFSLRYVLLLTTLDTESFLQFISNNPWPILREVFLSDLIEPMYGCSPKLIGMIYQLTLFNYQYETNEMELSTFVGKVTKIWYSLNSATYYDYNLSEELLWSAQCYELSIKLYIFSILGKQNLLLFLDDDVDYCIPELWRKLNDLSHKRKSLFFPNWCFWILVTVNIDSNDVERVKVLKLLALLQQNWPYSSVMEIKHAIITMWKVYDLGLPNRDENSPPFDTRRVVTQHKFMLALT